MQGKWRRCEFRRSAIIVHLWQALAREGGGGDAIRIEGYKSTSAPSCYMRGEARTALKHNILSLTREGWRRCEWLLHAGEVENVGWCHYAALWCARSASEGGVCPNMPSMLVGSRESRWREANRFKIMAHLFTYCGSSASRVYPHVFYLPPAHER